MISELDRWSATSIERVPWLLSQLAKPFLFLGVYLFNLLLNLKGKGKASMLLLNLNPWCKKEEEGDETET
jgi:hypothetical protein